MSLQTILCGALLGFYAVCGDLYTSEIACDDGWLKANNNCYYWNVKDLITYQEARQECQLQGADLMVVGSQSDLQWIQIQTEDYRTDAWWVGLNIDSTGIWNWVTGGGDNSIIKWRNEPDNYDDQDCGAINEFAKFGDEYCDSLFGFICKYVINRNEYCPDGPGWFPLDTGCFYVSDLLNSSQRLSWDDASTYCGNLVPGKKPVLLFINNMDEKNFIASQLQNSDPNGVMVPWWTGLNDIITEGKFTWQNGTLANMSLITWDSAPSPDRSLHQDCGIMYYGGVIDDMVCSKQAHYVCEKSAFVGKCFIYQCYAIYNVNIYIYIYDDK
ncbi:hypothetical protein ACJMK2_004894 [Sinanodonta woodiana]|uniref:C-type lectin domain-containing protein n=1 Tax=Sinanodonta woodiana TaxID=1069815 RepID=A0ABD3VRH0_SINWO